MVPSNALGVVLMMADPSTGTTTTDVATDVTTTAVPTAKWQGGPYFTLGYAPMATMDIHAHVYPGLRYDMETGLAWKRGRVRAYFGPDFHVMPYLGRKKK